LALNEYTLTKTGSNYIALANADVSLGNLVVNGGTLEVAGSTTSILAGVLANTNNATITVNTGATLLLNGTSSFSFTRDLVMAGGT
jgi:hypothetical protein